MVSFFLTVTWHPKTLGLLEFTSGLCWTSRAAYGLVSVIWRVLWMCSQLREQDCDGVEGRE